MVVLEYNRLGPSLAAEGHVRKSPIIYSLAPVRIQQQQVTTDVQIEVTTTPLNWAEACAKKPCGKKWDPKCISYCEGSLVKRNDQ